MIDPTSGTRQFREQTESDREARWAPAYENIQKQDPDETYRGFVIHRLDVDSNLVVILPDKGKTVPKMLADQQFTRRDYAKQAIDNVLMDIK